MLIVCLQTSGCPLLDELVVIFHQTATKMIREKSTKENISCAIFEGRLRTEFTYHTIGTIGGYKFFAEGENKKGRVRFSFLVEGTKEVDAYLFLPNPVARETRPEMLN